MPRYIMPLALILLICCGSSSYISPAELNEGYTGRYKLLIDIRDRKDFRDGHIPGAVNIEYNNSTFPSLIDRFDRSTGIVIYCGRGIKSDSAAEIFENKGFKKISILKGGFSQWTDQGFPSER